MKRLARLTAVLVLLLLWTAHTEPYAYTQPAAAQACDLTAVLAKAQWDADDYRLLAEQTGLFPPALDRLRELDALDTIYDVQKAYLSPAVVECSTRMCVTRSERLTEGGGLPAALEDGDILVTSCAHFFGFRNGHAGLVVDADAGKTLEAIVIGHNSSIQSIKRWSKFPSFAVFRLRGADAETRAAIAQTACRRLTGIPYSLAVGLYPDGRMPGEVTATQCAHLVWEAFAAYGYDLDANGGRIVTPADLACSPYLELKQVYGLPFSWVES